MDTSETYIKMCDCPEIQELRPIIGRGNYEANRRLGKPTLRCTSYSIPRNKIWLPRQDQLQEIIGETVVGLIGRLNAFYFEWDGLRVKRIDIYAAQFTSMEQLWLAFVMKEKYGMVWDGEKWKK